MRLSIIPLFILTFAVTASAETNIAESIEWRTVDSTIIVVGSVTAVRTVAVTGDRRLEDVTVRIAEVLRGRASGSLTFRWSRMPHQPDARAFRTAGTHVVFFLVDGVPTIEGGVYTGRLMPRTPLHLQNAIFDLSELSRRDNAALRADGSRARTPREVLDVIRRQVRVLSGRAVSMPQADGRRARGRGAVNVFDAEGEFRRVEVQPGTDAFSVLSMGSACYLVVPTPRLLAP